MAVANVAFFGPGSGPLGAGPGIGAPGGGLGGPPGAMPPGRGPGWGWGRGFGGFGRFGFGRFGAGPMMMYGRPRYAAPSGRTSTSKTVNYQKATLIDKIRTWCAKHIW